jgi:hypothetical protein
MRARLQRTGNHLIVRHIAHPCELHDGSHRLWRRGVCAFADECSKSFTECLFRHGARIITNRPGEFQAYFHDNDFLPRLTPPPDGCIHLRVKFSNRVIGFAVAAILAVTAHVCGQNLTAGEAEVMAEPIPPAVVNSAVEAVRKLGDEVVLGRYQAALDRMNPLWKQRTASRMGGMAELERKLQSVPAEMMRQGITMISFKPDGRPITHEVNPGTKKIRQNGVESERMAFTKWLVMVPTVTRYRIISGTSPKPVVIENTGFQVAIADKDKLDWTFIDGSGLTPADLRGLFITLPQDMELPPVGRREVP